MKLSFLVLLLLAPMLASCTDRPVDCSDIFINKGGKHPGVYTIYPIGEKGIQVYCDLGGWTVFQKRMDGTLNFYRPWDQYKLGFGSAAGEHWLGLDNLHYLTSHRKYELKVWMEDFKSQSYSATYSSFSVAAECDGYKLTVTGFTNGGAGDALRNHNGYKFSTFDKDQDIWSGNCAESYMGGFWFSNCLSTNPNGVYRWGNYSRPPMAGIEWHRLNLGSYSLKGFVMMVRPVQ